MVKGQRSKVKGDKKIFFFSFFTLPLSPFSFHLSAFTLQLILFALYFSLASCGYRPIGRLEPEALSIGTIAVPTWQNRTSYRGIEAVFTEKLIAAITRRGLARVVPPTDAEAVLQGRIASIADSASSYYSTGPDSYSPADYQVQVVIEIQITRKSDQKVLWVISNLREEAYYDARAEPLKLDSNRQDALARAAEAIARQVVNRWGGGF